MPTWVGKTQLRWRKGTEKGEQGGVGESGEGEIGVRRGGEGVVEGEGRREVGNMRSLN